MSNIARTIGLWLDNDECLYNHVRGMTRKVINDNTVDDDLDKDQAETDLARWLKNFIEEMNPCSYGMFGDIINHALSEIDWDEMAGEYIDEHL